jgi:hypothetical protein
LPEGAELAGVEDALVTSVRLPEPAPTRAPPDRLHCWAAEPLQSHNWTVVPLAVAAPATFTHLPPSPVRQNSQMGLSIPVDHGH